MIEDAQHVIDALKAELEAKQLEIDKLRGPSKPVFCRCGSVPWWLVLYGGPGKALEIIALNLYETKPSGLYQDEFPCCSMKCIEPLVSCFLQGTIGAEVNGKD